jgi:hypothetical protein
MKKSLVICLVLSACAPQQQATLEQQDQAQKIAKENVTFNARNFLTDRPDLKGVDIVVEGDSSISADCPQGDGWASVKLWDNAKGYFVGKMKCSTFSAERSCLLVDDFKVKSYHLEDGVCQSQLAFPIKPLKK